MNGPEGMGDHLSLDVDRLLAGSAVNSSQDGGSSTRSASSAAPVEHSISINCADGLKASALPTQDGFGYSPVPTSDALAGINGDGFSDDASTAGAGEIAECRICQEEDDVKNLETPCACSGSVKVRACIFVEYSPWLLQMVLCLRKPLNRSGIFWTSRCYLSPLESGTAASA